MGESLLDRTNPPMKAWVPHSPAIVLGNSQLPEKELVLKAVQDDAIPVYQRNGGGGTVVLSPKTVCLAIRFSRDKAWHIHDYFRAGSGVVCAVLENHLGLLACHQGISDLCLGSMKIAGCSLYMPRDFALYLVSVLIQDDISSIERYLAHPSREPDYREGRSHREFLTSVSSAAGRPVDPKDFAAWCEQMAWDTLKPDLDWTASS